MNLFFSIGKASGVAVVEMFDGSHFQSEFYWKSTARGVFLQQVNEKSTSIFFFLFD
jgi:hypothetical protein